MKIDSLKKLGNAEVKLAKMSSETQKKSLMEFSDDPEVAKIISYMNQYKDELPLSHPIFKHIEKLRADKENRSMAKDIVSEKQNQRKQNELEREEANKKASEAKAQINDMLKGLERETDKIFDFLTKNQKVISSGDMGYQSLLKTKRFLISVKNGFRYGEMK